MAVLSIVLFILENVICLVIDGLEDLIAGFWCWVDFFNFGGILVLVKLEFFVQILVFGEI